MMKIMGKFAIAILAAATMAPLAIAQEQPELALSDVNGQKHTLGDYRGKAVVVNFWATWCAGCQHEMPLFLDLQKRYGDAVQVVTVSVDDATTRDKIGAFAAKYKMDVPILLGTADDLKRLGLGEALPATMFLDASGNVVARVLGEVTKNDLRSRVDWIVSNKGSAPPALANNFSKKSEDDAAIHMH